MNLKIRQATKEGYIEVEPHGVFDMAYPESKTRRGRVQGKGGNICPTILCSNEIMVNEGMKKNKKFRIRKLTPKECFRLMGVEDADIQKIQQSGVSIPAQYKLAGNSIVVDVLYHVFRKLIIEPEMEKADKGEQLSLF